MNTKILYTFLFIFSCNMLVFSQEGKLEKGKESLNTENTTGKVQQSSTSGSYQDNSINPFMGIFMTIAAYTFYGVAIESPWETRGRMHSAEISNYPYKEARYGNFIYTDSINYNITRFDITSSFVMENSRLYGTNFGVNFRFFKRFALDIDYLYLSEKVGNNRDSYKLYAVLLKYYRIRIQRFDAWFGVGIMRVGSNVNKSGFGMGVGAEWFITKPISLDFSHKFTSINDRGVNKTKLGLKYHLKNYHIFSGYEHFKIGVSKIDAFSVGVGASF